MERVNGILCATKEELVSSAIISEAYLGFLTSKKTLQIVVRGCRGRQAQYAVDSLPAKYKAEVYKRFDVPVMDREPSLLERLIQPHPEAVRYFHTYRLADGRCLPPERIAQYIAEARILEAMSAYIMEHTSKRGKASKRPLSKGAIYGQLAELVEELPLEEYPHRLPKSRLGEKHEAYQRDGLSSLIHRGYQNRNASKVGSNEQTALLLMLLANPNNLNNKQVARLYNETADSQGWPKLTASAVGKIAKANRLLLEAGRKGQNKFRLDRHKAIRRSKPTRSLTYWTLDGWDVELYYQRTSDGKTRYDCRLVLEAVIDPVSNYIVGYAIGERETPALISQALRSAAHHTEELFGVKCSARQLQYDHYGEKVLRDLYSALSEVCTPARVHNARAKVIEPFFRYLNETYCQLLPNWSGFGVTTRKGKKPNTDALNALKGKTPTREEVEGQIHRFVAADRAKKQAEYVGAFDGDLTGVALEPQMYLEHWGESTERLLGQSVYGLTPTILGRMRYYESFDLGFEKLTHLKWQVYYDPSDLSQVLAVSEDRLHKYLLTEKHVQPMALEDQTEADVKHLKQVRTFQRSVEDWVSDSYERMKPLALASAEGNTIARNLLENSIRPFSKRKKSAPEEVEDISDTPWSEEVEVMITDKQGQYKSNRYDRKLQREGIASEADAPKPKRRSILERV